METRVYEQLLDEAVRYTLEVASLLPRFETAVAAESLKRLSNLGQDVADVRNTVQRLEARVVESTVPGQDARWKRSAAPPSSATSTASNSSLLGRSCDSIHRA